MPTYNHEKFVSIAIEGVLNQKTSFNFELLIHDDASTDHTQHIIKQYAAKFPNIIKPIYQVQNQHSLGIPNSLILFPLAKCKYIAICEGDDYWTDPYKLQKQVDFLEQNADYNLCFHKVSILDGEEIKEDWITCPPRKSFTTIYDLLEFANYIHTPSVVFRNNIGELPIWYQACPIGDYALYLLVVKNGKIKYFEETMAVYRYGVGMFSSSRYDQQSWNWNYTLFLISKFFDEELRPTVKMKLMGSQKYIAQLNVHYGVPQLSIKELSGLISIKKTFQLLLYSLQKKFLKGVGKKNE